MTHNYTQITFLSSLKSIPTDDNWDSHLKKVVNENRRSLGCAKRCGGGIVGAFEEEKDSIVRIPKKEASKHSEPQKLDQKVQNVEGIGLI